MTAFHYLVSHATNLFHLKYLASHAVQIVLALVLTPAVVVFWEDAVNLAGRVLVFMFFPAIL
jgi:hypothetical protein